jgi:hypothetical protein
LNFEEALRENLMILKIFPPSFPPQKQFSFLIVRNPQLSAPKSSTLFENISQIYQNDVYGRALNRELNDFYL